MKRATGNPVGAGFFERHIVLDDAHNVRLALEIVDEGLWETHGLFYEPASQEDQIIGA